MKIAILYICTGRYNQFFKGFYNSAIRYFMVGVDKKFFVWTDDDNLCDSFPNTRLIHKECAGFPADSLFRFDMFLQIEDELKEYDFVYFFNSNAEFKQPVGSEILPDESGLAVGVWGGKESKRHPMFYSYERNRSSLAYIKPYGNNYKLYMGGLNGGRSKEYLEMCHVLADNIRKDYQKGIVAIAHDQSHINAYLRTHKCKLITPEYCWPEEWASIEFKPKIVFRNKVKYDFSFDKGRGHSMYAKMKRAFFLFWHALRWYIYI